jgi:predicted lipoprotein with Yx(FWY)xxD motif
VGVRIRLLPIALAALAAIVGCGSSSSSGGDPMVGAAQASPPSAATAAKSKGPRVKVVDSDYGRVLANARGRALYLFTADHGNASSCSGDCAKAWPPYLVKAKPAAGSGARAGKIGVTRRGDGRLQATYAGHPVYFYEGDNEPGEVLCQAVNEFGGYWYVLRANGKAVR